MLAAPSLHNLDAVYFNADTSSAAMQRAAGLLTLSSGSGSVGADVNGVSVVDTWATLTPSRLASSPPPSTPAPTHW
jgi:hypothetical protein